VRVALPLILLTSAACGVDAPADPDASAPLEDATTATRDAGGPDAPFLPARYPPDTVHSPITPAVVARLRAIAASRPAGHDDVFLKTGASGTETAAFLTCFDGAKVDLAGRSALQAGIEHFKAGRIGPASPFARVSAAVKIGRSASWALAGDPSPLELELAASSPRFAIVDFGTNDMQQATSYAGALDPFYGNLSTLLDRLEAEGVVPIVTGLWPRTDLAEAAAWVPTFAAVTRAIAEARQLPYLDLYHATVTLPGQGLVGDGVHGNSYGGGACVFTQAGLAYHYNVRNLATLEALDAVRRVVVEDEAAPDPLLLDPLAGNGTAAAPFVVDALGFVHSDDTRGGERARDGYPGCDAGQDESGPERSYRLSLAAPTAVRIVVLDRGAVDVDVHVITNGACAERDDRIIDRTLPAGEHLIVVDSFVSGGVEKSGTYSLLVLPN
jgi:GDSL-like Lipase/Acylhydrolase family